MKASAKDGGFSAKVLQSPSDQSWTELQRLQEDGPEDSGGAAASLAWDDWFRTLGQLRRAARRRYAPSHSLPAEL
eukprot:5675608-Pyramimonas_sp.AAC.1